MISTMLEFKRRSKSYKYEEFFMGKLLDKIEEMGMLPPNRRFREEETELAVYRNEWVPEDSHEKE